MRRQVCFLPLDATSAQGEKPPDRRHASSAPPRRMSRMAKPRLLMMDDLLLAAVAGRRVHVDAAGRSVMSSTSHLHGLLAGPPVFPQSPPYLTDFYP